MAGGSCYFEPKTIATVQIRLLVDDLFKVLPQWIVDMYFKNKGLDAKSLVQNISDEPKWFDHFPISLLGTNPAGGSAPLTETNQPGPRRLMLSSKINGPTYDGLYKCMKEELYGYSYSVTPRPYNGLRSLEQYDPLAEMGFVLWTLVMEHLDHVSQKCPPNSCNVLYYFKEFKGKMNPHQDNSPRMAIDPMDNSQILGTSVMVFSLFATQAVKFISVKTKKMSMHF